MTNAVRNMADADVSEKVDEFVSTFGHNPVERSGHFNCGIISPSAGALLLCSIDGICLLILLELTI